MTLYTYLTLALAAIASAGTLHNCAGKCVGDAIAATGCASSNSHCVCSSDVFLSSVESCVAASCGSEEKAAATSLAESFCKTVSSVKRDVEERQVHRPEGAWHHGHHKATAEEWEQHLHHKDDRLHEEYKKLEREKASLHDQSAELYKELQKHPNNEKLREEYKAVRAQEVALDGELEKWQHHENHLQFEEHRHHVAPAHPHQPPPPHYHHQPPPYHHKPPPHYSHPPGPSATVYSYP